MRYFLILVFAFYSLVAQASTMLQDEATYELNMIKRVFATAYAPGIWKKQKFGWDLETEYQKAISAVANKSDFSVDDYHLIATNFLRSTKDYHVGIYFYSTEKSTLPISVAGTQGRYFVVYIDRVKLAENQFSISVGDEVLEFGGRPIKEVIAEIKTRINWSVDETDEALAQLYLTKRSSRGNMEIPQGPIEIKVKHIDGATKEETIITRQIAWDYTPEDMSWNGGPTMQPMALTDAAADVKTNPLRKQMMWAGWKTYKKFLADDDEDGDEQPQQKPAPNPFSIGQRVSWVPALGPKVWESEATAKFNAYIYKNDDGKLIGYVRIPHYDVSTPEFTEFKALMKKFEEVTDALVIDEVNNPGGSVLYVYALMTVLYDKASFAPPHQIALYPEGVKEAADFIRTFNTIKNDKDAQKALSAGQDNIDGYPINFTFAQFTMNFSRFILQQWQSGKTLTDPIYLWGVDKINPDKEVNYSKPIMVLVNSLCFSGGDFFPAMLQDNGRAKIFGTRTAGAGGYIGNTKLPSRLGLEEFSYTGSLAHRIGNNPIENLGVTPDIPYEVKPEDFTGGFASYKKAVNAALSGLIVDTKVKKPEVPVKP